MAELKTLLKEHPNLAIKERKDGKSQVVCQLTSHEMPYTMKAVQMYINGKKYKYACEHKLSTKEEELCSQYLIEKRRGQLYCNLTKRHLNNLPHHIRKHLNGRRFQKAINNINSPTQRDLTEQQKTEGKKDTEIWMPSDSESESAEVEGLGSEFEDDETKFEDEDSYSFDALDKEETQSKDNEEASDSKKGSKKKLKRSATTGVDKTKKKSKKLKKDSKETPKKKKKRA